MKVKDFIEKLDDKNVQINIYKKKDNVSKLFDMCMAYYLLRTYPVDFKTYYIMNKDIDNIDFEIIDYIICIKLTVKENEQ